MKIYTLFVPILLLISSANAQRVEVDNEYEKGVIVDGLESGAWEYYDEPGELALKINYSNSKLIYLKPDTGTYVIYIDGQWVESKVDRQARYIGSMHDFEIINKLIVYPAIAREKKTCGTFHIVFEIDTLGIAGDFSMINDIGDGCSEEVIRNLKTMPNYWVPAKLDGKNYSSRLIIPVKYNLKIDGEEISPRKNKHKADLPIAKELYKFEISLDETTRNSATQVKYTTAQEMPEFPGGERQMFQYIHERIQSPDESIRGRVYVSFIVTKLGKIENIEIIKSLGFAFDQEAIRLISNMPNWIPGKENGIPVDVKYNLPIVF